MQILAARLAVVFTCIILSSGIARALTLNTIVSTLKTQSVLDTFEVDINMVMTMQGRSVAMNSHLICKGEEKMWMEQKSSLGTQRTIRNGAIAQTVDMGTGKKQNMKLADLEKMGAGAINSASFFEMGRYAAPKSIGADLYAVELVPASDTSVVSRTLVYDANHKQLTRIIQKGHDQDSTVTEMSYTIVDGKTALRRLDMDIQVQDLSNRISIVYSGYSVPRSISDDIFSIQE